MGEIQLIEVRRLKPNDIADVVVMMKQFYDLVPRRGEVLTWSPYRAESWLKSACTSLFSLILVLVDGESKPLGFMIGQLAKNIFSEDLIASEVMFWIDPLYRSFPNSVLMINEFERWGRSHRAKLLGLSSIASLRSVGKLYERLGYSLQESSYYKVV